MILQEKGSLSYIAQTWETVKVRCTGEFVAWKNEEIVGPNHVLDRVIKYELKPMDNIMVKTGTKDIVQYEVKQIRPRREMNSGESQLEEKLDDEEQSIYNRMKTEIMKELGMYAKAKGVDTPEDEESLDMDFEDEDEGLIDTPYEFEAMREEYLLEQKDIEAQNKKAKELEIAQNPTEEIEIKEEETAK